MKISTTNPLHTAITLILAVFASSFIPIAFAQDHAEHDRMPDSGMNPMQMEEMDHSHMQEESHQGMMPNTNSIDTQDPSIHQHVTPAADASTQAGDSASQMQPSPHVKMEPMQGGNPPSNARDPNAYANGLKAHPMHGMEMADDALFGHLMINELEATYGSNHRGQNLNAEAWYGGDYNKAWLKVEGERHSGRLEAVRNEILWDRVFTTFWSTQLGVRHDSGNGPSKTWSALGIRGLAPYWFEIETTAYLGSGGTLAGRAEVRYELLFTQRLILEPKLEANAYSNNDVDRKIGSGFSDVQASVRLRYEIRRQFAPYLGVSWSRKLGNTANIARQAGEEIQQTSVVAGVRLWF